MPYETKHFRFKRHRLKPALCGAVAKSDGIVRSEGWTYELSEATCIPCLLAYEGMLVASLKSVRGRINEVDRVGDNRDWCSRCGFSIEDTGGEGLLSHCECP